MTDEFEAYLQLKKDEKAAEIQAVHHAETAAARKAQAGITKFETIVRPVLARASAALRKEGITLGSTAMKPESGPTSLASFRLEVASAGGKRVGHTETYRLGFDAAGDPVAARSSKGRIDSEHDLRPEIGLNDDLTPELAAAVIKLAIDEWFQIMSR